MKLDPRTKIICLMIFSTLAIVFNRLEILSFILFIELIIAYMLKAQVFTILKKLKSIILVLVVLIFIQSIFTSQGVIILSIGKIKLLTDIGIEKGLAYLLRVLIIFLSGIILTTSKMRDTIQGLIQLKVPYDIAFMVSIGIKFVPLLMQEFKNTLVAIELRGININSLKIKKKIELYSYIFFPVIMSSLNRARLLSISIETRGFRAFEKRTSLYELKYQKIDFLIFLITIVISLTIVKLQLR